MNDEGCSTCYGTGEVSGVHGPERCADCGGLGTMPTGMTLTERRLRDLERAYERRGGEVEADVRWLVGEVRRAHHALVQILAAAHEASDDDASATQVRCLANDVLRVYPKEPV